MITDECIACGACKEACPLDCIWENFDGYDEYLINPDECNLCKGEFDEPQCMEVCPMEGAVVYYKF